MPVHLQVSGNLPDDRLLYTNSLQATRVFRQEPASFIITLQAQGDPAPLSATGYYLVTVGLLDRTPWTTARASGAQIAKGLPLKCNLREVLQPGVTSITIKVSAEESRQVVLSAAYSLNVVWVGHSGFDPALHGYKFINSGEVYGPVSLDRAIFDGTYGPVIGREKLYRKLYRDILGATVDEAGPIPGSGPLSSGLCTGMMRSALDFFQREASPLARDREPNGETLAVIKLFHGRQLTDRALLQATRWILRGGPRRVFYAFKAGIIQGNKDPLAFDIGVPAWGRPDFWQAVQSEGHTVIPYAFRQSSPTEGEIFIYNPNNPAQLENYGYANALDPATPRLTGPVIRFDLAQNTYFYTDHYRSVRSNGQATTIVAVPQSAYRKGRSALLASLANHFI